MGLTTTLIGGGFGLGVQLFSNAMQKIPLSRKPWLHALLFVSGAYVGHKYPKWEQGLVEDINEIRAEKGLHPMVGTSAWIRYQAPEELGTKKSLSQK